MYVPLSLNVCDPHYMLGYDDLRYPKTVSKEFDPWSINEYPAFDQSVHVPKFVSALDTQELGSYAASKCHRLGLSRHTVIYCAYFKRKIDAKQIGKNHMFYDVYDPKSGLYVRVYKMIVYYKYIKNEFPPDHFRITEEQNDLLKEPDLRDWYKG